jgi:hypothetical protein
MRGHAPPTEVGKGRNEAIIPVEEPAAMEIFCHVTDGTPERTGRDNPKSGWSAGFGVSESLVHHCTIAFIVNIHAAQKQRA